MQPRSMMYTFVLALFLPVALAAEQMIFEVMEPGVTTLTPCVPVHQVGRCNMYHPEGVTITTSGMLLKLDGQDYLIEWSGPGYYLESGAILEPLGEIKTGLGGQLWLEVYPDQGKIHTSRAWKDNDGNQALSSSDTLMLGTAKASKPLKVKDVRLHVRVRSFSERPEHP